MRIEDLGLSDENLRILQEGLPKNQLTSEQIRELYQQKGFVLPDNLVGFLTLIDGFKRIVYSKALNKSIEAYAFNVIHELEYDSREKTFWSWGQFLEKEVFPFGNVQSDHAGLLINEDLDIFMVGFFKIWYKGRGLNEWFNNQTDKGRKYPVFKVPKYKPEPSNKEHN